MKNKTSSSSSDSYYRAQYEVVCKERDALLATVNAQQRDIHELKRSVYELSYMLSMQGSLGLPSFSIESAPAGNAGSPNAGAARPLFNPSLGFTGHLDPLQFPMMNEAGVGGASSGASDRVLVPETKLSGHTAAVYVAKFSPRSSLVASAGLDSTLRLWEGTYPYSPVACLKGHRQPISDLCWTPDGRSILSASFDQTVGKWDAETGQCAGNMLGLEGLVQCIQVAAEGGGDGGTADPLAGVVGAGRLAYAGSTSKKIYTVDTRDPMAVVASWACDAFVNSLHVYSDGSKVMSADASGKICIWDVRTGRMVDSHCPEAPIHISHIQASPPDAGRPYEEGIFLAANCYDNTVRIYQRRLNFNSTSINTGIENIATATRDYPGNAASGNVVGSSSHNSSDAGKPSSADAPVSESLPPSNLVAGSGGPMGIGGGNVGDGAGGNKEPPLELICALRGHTGRNWPIRCTFFRGLHHRPPRMRLGGAKGKDSRHSGAGVGGRGGTGLETGVEGMGKGVQVSGLGYDDLGKDWQHSLVLATGSADGNIYVFDLSKGQGCEMQVLKGHRAHVYSADFHPTEPKLVSCGADKTVRIWVPNWRRNSRK